MLVFSWIKLLQGNKTEVTKPIDFNGVAYVNKVLNGKTVELSIVQNANEVSLKIR